MIEDKIKLKELEQILHETPASDLDFHQQVLNSYLLRQRNKKIVISSVATAITLLMVIISSPLTRESESFYDLKTAEQYSSLFLPPADLDYRQAGEAGINSETLIALYHVDPPQGYPAWEDITAEEIADF